MIPKRCLLDISGTIDDEPVFETVERIRVKGRVSCSPAACGIKSANEKTGFCRSFCFAVRDAAG